MSPPTVPQAVQSCHELLLWLIPHLDKFPRARRFTLGARIEASGPTIRTNPSVPAGEIQYSRLVRLGSELCWLAQPVWSGGREIL